MMCNELTKLRRLKTVWNTHIFSHFFLLLFYWIIFSEEGLFKWCSVPHIFDYASLAGRFSRQSRHDSPQEKLVKLCWFNSVSYGLIYKIATSYRVYVSRINWTGQTYLYSFENRPIWFWKRLFWSATYDMVCISSSLFCKNSCFGWKTQTLPQFANNYTLYDQRVILISLKKTLMCLIYARNWSPPAQMCSHFSFRTAKDVC